MNIACYIRNLTIHDQVKTALVRAGFIPTHFNSETALLRSLKRQTFELVIIDLGSAADSESIFSWLSLRSGEALPTLLLSPSRTGDLVARALNCGADDFLERPFEAVELIARINAILRRASPASNRRSIEYAGFQLLRDSAKFSYQGNAISLTPREFSMAWLFFSSPGVYISRETLGAVIWSADSEIAGRTIEQHVYKLRKKLLINGRQVVVLRTAYSHGYRLELVADGAEGSLPLPQSQHPNAVNATGAADMQALRWRESA